MILRDMDALPIVPAVALSFGATYYLGKACLMLIVSSLEQPGHARRKRSQHAQATANGLPQSVN